MTIDSFTASVALSSRARRKAFMGVDHIHAHNLKPSRRLTLQSQCAFYGQSFS